jgi:mono/diheme cytochrome c family protein
MRFTPDVASLIRATRLKPNNAASYTNEKPLRELPMTKAVFRWLIIASGIIAFSGQAWAQSPDTGKTAYRSSCAPCHGADGKGDGFVNAVLKTPAPDLTMLAKRNDGEFPIAAVNEIIDGRTLIAAHGTREMPIWGFDVMVRNRIVEIVDYLNRIQAK